MIPDQIMVCNMIPRVQTTKETLDSTKVKTIVLSSKGTIKKKKTTQDVRKILQIIYPTKDQNLGYKKALITI